MKKAIVLVRVSSKDQEDGYSLEARLPNLIRNALKFLSPYEKIVRIYDNSPLSSRVGGT